MMRHRYLFEQMVRRELRARYKGSTLGVLWYVVNPLVLMGAYTFMFGTVLPLPRVADYPLFLIVGLIVWMFFSQALLAAAPSLVEQAGLIGKARFPRETIPASVVSVQLVTFLVVLAIATPVTLAIRGTSSWALLLLPLLVVAIFCFVLGLGLMVSVLHAFYRDVTPVLSAALLPWFFITPIFFSLDNLPFVDRHPWIGDLLRWGNPVAPFIEAFRAVIYSGELPSAATSAYVAVATVVVLSGGLTLFRRMQRELAVVL